MARIETANLDGLQMQHANISGIVGIGQKNEKNDVMLIQALFRLVVLDDNLIAKKNFGLDLQDLPEPTGVFDDKTVRAIAGFQRMSSDFLISSDGRIHPASYVNRVIKLSGRLMAITHLNNLAAGGVAGLRKRLPDAIRQIAPTIMFT